jgi:hypothetical protein
MPILEANYEQGMTAYEQAADKGDAELIKMGFPGSQRPMITIDGVQQFADRPTLPERLSDLSMSDLQDLLGWFTAWHSYSIERIPPARIMRNTAEAARDFAWAKIRKEKKGTVSDKNDAARTDMRYVQANTAYETAEYIFNMVKGITEGLYREIETISRVITGLEQKVGAEGHRYSGERRGTSMHVGPSFKPTFKNDVMARFRTGVKR